MPYDEFLALIAGSRVNIAERERFAQVFDREAMVAAFLRGESEISLETYAGLGVHEPLWMRTTAKLTEDARTHDIKGVLYAVDIDDQVKDNLILQNVTDEEYDFIGLIDVVADSFEIRFKGKGYYAQGIDMTGNAAVKFCDDRFGFVPTEDREEFFAAISPERLKNELDRAASYRISVREYDCKGAIRHKLLHYSYFDDSHRYIVATKSDVTELYEQDQKRMKELRDALDTAEQATQAKSRFLSNVSHDMRTPLNGVIGFTDLALQTDDPALRQSYLEKIRDSGVFMLQLINDTLDISKIESRHMTLKLSPVDPHALISGVVTAVQPSATQTYRSARGGRWR